METGDIIDVRIAEHCTRGACPLPPSQTLSNIHYLVNPPAQVCGPIQEQQEQPEAPNRITMTIKDQNGSEMLMRTKVDTPFQKIFDAFAKYVRRDTLRCRFHLDGQRLNGDQNPQQVSSGDRSRRRQ